MLFALPVALDVAIYRDNNIRAILHHANAHKGLQQKFMQSLKYEFSFLAFVPDPEVVLKSASAHLVSKRLVEAICRRLLEPWMADGRAGGGHLRLSPGRRFPGSSVMRRSKLC